MDYKKYLIAIPTLDTVPVPFVSSITRMRRVGAVKYSFLSNSMVYDARNALAKEAIDTGADRILFIDSDMYFGLDTMERMAEDMDAGAQFVCAMFYKRQLPLQPCVYKRVEIIETEDGISRGIAEPYTNYPNHDTLFTIGGCGFGAVMIDTQLIIDVANHYGPPFLPYIGLLGEDLSFCYRARQLGYELWCDPRIKVGHVGLYIYGNDLNVKKPG